MGDPVRRETATTTVAADAIEIKRKEFLELARREDAGSIRCRRTSAGA